MLDSHSFPRVLSQKQAEALMDDDGNVKLTCAACPASYTVTPNFVAGDGTLRRKLVSADESVRNPCSGTDGA